MVNYKLIVIAFLLFVISPAVATNIEDISYHYSAGLFAEANADFNKAESHYLSCKNIAMNTLQPEWEQLCQEKYDYISSISDIRTRNFPVTENLNWKFMGEISEPYEDVTQYFKTDNSDIVAINAHKFNYTLTQDEVYFFLILQKLQMDSAYSVEHGNLTYNNISMSYLLGSNCEGKSYSFVGAYFDDFSMEFYTIMASVENPDAFLEGFGYKKQNITAPAIFTFLLIIFFALYFIFKTKPVKLNSFRIKQLMGKIRNLPSRLGNLFSDEDESKLNDE